MMRKNNSGITLISLVITIILLLILATIGISSGISTVRSSRLTKFTTEMNLMQQKVNELYDSYTNNRTVNVAGNEYTGTDIANIGNDISDVSEEQRNEVFSSSGSGITDTSGYRYYNASIIDGLGIDGVDGEFFVNVAKRSVISVDGFEYEGNKYYTLEQLPEGLYNVEYNPQQVEGGPTFDVNYEKIGNDKYKISISNIQYEGYINKWNVKYKLEDTESWRISENLEFQVNETGKYKIVLFNDNEQSEEKEFYVLGGYTKSGLLVHYDSINNTGEGDNKHSTSTTVWKDLSGNENDATLKGFTTNDEFSGWKENKLSFNGNTDYVTLDNVIENKAEFTIEFVFAQKRNVSWQYLWGILGNRLGLESNIGGNRSLYFSTETSHVEFPELKKDLNVINNITISIGNNEIKAYSNGKKVREYSFQGNLYTQGDLFAIGADSTGSYKTQADYYSFRIYDKILGDEEVEYNYNIDKIRFNIKE